MIALEKINSMKKALYLIIALLVCSIRSTAQESPHGKMTRQCTDCHTTNAWTALADPMKFNHSETGYILVGQHRTTACKSCHIDLHFAGTPKTCFACHARDYDDAIAVNHRTAGFTTDCSQCHSISAASWQASFDHDRTQFPTRGAHYAVPCVQCHVNNRFRGTPIQCDACHHNVYLTATNPPHTNFSTDCATCHPALSWDLPSFIPHPYFPIASGARHQPLSTWHSCTDCHQNSTSYPSSYSSYICYNCHTHALATMKSTHTRVSGYDPAKCYNCHPSP